MIDLFKQFFDSNENQPENYGEQQVKLAAASLLAECMRADHEVTPIERAAFETAVEQALGVDHDELHSLIDDATASADAATSTYEFTRLINDHYTATQKASLIEAMWMIAYADGDLDRYEEHLIRKVAELIYVSHKDFIRLKLAARATTDLDQR